MKTCSYKDCPWPVFSSGYCKAHQHCRTDDKYKRSQQASKERSAIKRHKVLSKSKSVSEATEWGYIKQIDMFYDLWDNMDKPRMCLVSGRPLDKWWGKPMWVNCFAHILPKKNYRHYKLNPRNIMVVDPEVHTLFDQGTQAQRDAYPSWNWSILYERVEELKKEYAQYLKIKRNEKTRN